MKYFFPLVLTLVLSACNAHADGGAGEIRQQAFKKVLRAFEPMGLVVRGRTPYEKAAFIKQADTLKTLAAQPFTLFADKKIDDKSRAKPEIWSQPAKFQAAKDTFLNNVNQLDAAAQKGDLGEIKQAYGQVAQSCKACHDSFRGPER